MCESVVTMTEEATTNVDVLIVGAGLAGLSAGLRLRERAPELAVAVVEAADRVGGRTLSIRVKEDTFDLGAHWIGSRQTHIMELVKRFGIEYYRQNVTGRKVGCAFLQLYLHVYERLVYTSPAYAHFSDIRLKSTIRTS